MRIRTAFFWAHLTAGVCAGAVVLVMSFTGVLLMYERQILARADQGAGSAACGAARLPLDTLVDRVRAADAALQVTGITVRSDPAAPVAIAAGSRTLFVDACSGAVLGDSSRSRVRAAMSRLREWHRWLAFAGDGRAAGRAITGWASVVFLGIICSGMYLWLPRRWSRPHVRAVLFFRGSVRGRARDFNWHNVLGIWCAVPLLLVVASALPISFPWANAAVYRAVGEQPPVQPAAARARGPFAVQGLDQAFAAASRRVAEWRSLSARLPAVQGAYVITADRGEGGQPHLRETVVVGPAGEVRRVETFADQTLGRRIRSISRFLHTGEVLGPAGQTAAGLASAGATVLVWTGLALAARRLLAAARETVDRRTRAAAGREVARTDRVTS